MLEARASPDAVAKQVVRPCQAHLHGLAQSPPAFELALHVAE
jgi:hypothetical protein